MARVVIENLVKVFPGSGGRDRRAVDGLSLTIEDREFMVLVGPSGCGKTTTLRMIAGLEPVTDGTIAIDGRAVNDLPPKDRDLAMVFQNYALYPHLSVAENLAFGLRLRKLPAAEIDQRVREAARTLGIEDLLTHKPRSLSGGQQQRVAVGRAIVRQPKVFLFDEPLSNLDAKLRVTTRAGISKLHARLGATMIYVTHDQVEAMTMGDRICVMNEGRIMQVAPPLELYHHPANLFVAGFIGSPPMNFIHGTVQSVSGGLVFFENNEISAPLRLHLNERLAARAARHVGRHVVLGLRPEDVHDALAVTAPPPGTSAEVAVDVAEPLGAETYLYLNTGQHAVLARLRGGGTFDAAQRLRVVFDLDRAHLFDPATGVAL